MARMLSYNQVMTTLTFDTLKFANKLKSAGVPAPQAEAEAMAIAEAFEASDLVTKTDLSIAVAEVKSDLIKWMVGLSMAQIGLIVAILIKLSH